MVQRPRHEPGPGPDSSDRGRSVLTWHCQAPFSQNSNLNYTPNSGPILFGQGEHLGSAEWRCSTFLLMLTELWFGNIPAPRTNYILRSTTPLGESVSNIQPYSANIDQRSWLGLNRSFTHRGRCLFRIEEREGDVRGQDLLTHL